MSQRINKMTHLRSQLVKLAIILAICAMEVMGQGTFQSGSTGADGAFNPTTSQSVAVPESGVFNFTTVNIPSGVTITFVPNSKNSPVVMLASGDVVISGTINVAGSPGNFNGSGGKGGPGGFAGGNGGYGVADLFAGTNGSGPGGGRGGASINGGSLTAGGGGSYATVVTVNASSGIIQGTPYGSGLLQPLIGGSGGGGGGAGVNRVAGAGGGGGGAILIASSTTITLSSNGVIDATGGFGPNVIPGSLGGGGGSGGAIRLIANTISGNGRLSVTGGSGGGVNGTLVEIGPGGLGFIRAEAFNLTNFSPNTPSTIASLGTPNPVVITNAPELKIVSVAGIAAPAITSGSLSSSPDITVPSSQTNPVTVVLEGRNLPNTTLATVTVTPLIGIPSLATTGIFAATGTPSVTTATTSINLPIGTSVINALAVIDLSLAQLEPMFMDGEKVERIEITAVYGGDSKTTYITSSGKKIIK